MRKIPTSLYVEEAMIQRADRLAIVTGATRSEVLRTALEVGVHAMECSRIDQIKEFARIAARFGMPPLELAARMTRDNLHYRTVRYARVYPGDPALAA